MKASGGRGLPRVSFVGPLSRSPPGAAAWREAYPFRRSTLAVVFVLAMDVIFMVPAVTTFQEALALWRRPDDLFSLVSALFVTFWLMGWSLAPLLLTTLLLVLLWGREEVRAGPGAIEVAVGLPRLGLAMRYDPAVVCNLRIEQPPPKSGKSWRGRHVAFDYGVGTGEFGSEVDPGELPRIRAALETATGRTLREGDALPGEAADDGRSASSAPADFESTLARTRRRIVVDEQVTLSSPSTLALVAANLLPLSGALFMDWDLGLVMVLYWAESAVIGFFTLCKIAVIGRWMALLAGPFFLGHFGAFMAVHFLFLYTLFVRSPFEDSATATSLPEVARMFHQLWPALVALFLSHGFSFLRNFIGRGEYRGRTVKAQMAEPYHRIVFMHLVIIFGGGLTLVLGEARPVLLLLIVLKILVDVRAHLRERREGDAAAG